VAEGAVLEEVEAEVMTGITILAAMEIPNALAQIMLVPLRERQIKARFMRIAHSY
jgi:hypothetical protein